MKLFLLISCPWSYSPGISQGCDTHNLVPFRYFELYYKGNIPNLIKCKGQTLVHKKQVQVQVTFHTKSNMCMWFWGEKKQVNLLIIGHRPVELEEHIKIGLNNSYLMILANLSNRAQCTSKTSYIWCTTDGKRGKQ